MSNFFIILNAILSGKVGHRPILQLETKVEGSKIITNIISITRGHKIHSAEHDIVWFIAYPTDGHICESNSPHSSSNFYPSLLDKNHDHKHGVMSSNKL